MGKGIYFLGRINTVPIGLFINFLRKFIMTMKNKGDSEFEMISMSFSINDIEVQNDALTCIRGHIRKVESINSLMHKEFSQIYFAINSISPSIFRCSALLVYLHGCKCLFIDNTRSVPFPSDLPLLLSVEINGELLSGKEISPKEVFNSNVIINKIIFFKDWQEEFCSLSQLRCFLAGYMLIVS